MKGVKALIFSGLLASTGMAQAAGTINNLPEIQAKLQARIEAMVARSVQADLARPIKGSRECVPQDGKNRQYAEHGARAKGES